MLIGSGLASVRTSSVTSRASRVAGIELPNYRFQLHRLRAIGWIGEYRRSGRGQRRKAEIDQLGCKRRTVSTHAGKCLGISDPTNVNRLRR